VGQGRNSPETMVVAARFHRGLLLSGWRSGRGGMEEAVGVRRTLAASKATSVRRRSVVGQGRSARWLGASKKKMRLFF
jgi:hypothetical protein